MTRELGKKLIRSCLVIAGLHSLFVGFVSLFFPEFVYELIRAKEPLSIFTFQMFGVVTGIFGLGYLLSAYDPYRYWPILLLGFIYQLLVPAVYFLDLSTGILSVELTSLIVFNYLIWVIPFGLSLRKIYNDFYATDTLLLDMFSERHYPLHLFVTSEGIDLEEMTQKQPVLVVFLRHFGCTFCRESLHDLAKVKNRIEQGGTRLLIVHMVDNNRAQEVLARYGLGNVPTLSDPECILYKRFSLCKGRLLQLFGAKPLWRGIVAGIFKGNGIGEEEGDAFQMPGVFLLKKGEIHNRFIHHTAADRPDYLSLAQSSSSSILNQNDS